MFPLDLLAVLPEPRDDEPLSLRTDIADELADHLQCAFRREVLKDGDAAAARRRALDRFGDPQKLARRLWWQAMRSRLMRQRIVSGLQWLVALMAMLISGAVFWQQSQLLAELRQSRQEDAAQRQALTAKLDQLQPPTATFGTPGGLGPDQFHSEPFYQPATAGAPPNAGFVSPDTYNSNPLGVAPDAPPGYLYGGPPALVLKFVQETEDGPPVCPTSLTLTSSAGVENHGERNIELMNVPTANQYYPGGGMVPNGAERESTMNNKVVFRWLEPDLYQLWFTLADGQQSERPLLIRAEKTREMTIICPAPRKKIPVSIAIKPLPDDLKKRKLEVRLDVWAGTIEIGQASWTTPNLPSQTIKFDAQTGLATAIDVGRTGYFNLRDLPPDERCVFLPVGAIHYRLGANQPSDGSFYQWPESYPLEGAGLYTVKPDESTWQLDLPREFLDKMLCDVDAANSSPAATPFKQHPDPDAQRKLAGTWIPLASPDGRTQVQDVSVEVGTVIITGNTATRADATRGDGKVMCKIAVDGTKLPWWIDIGSNALLSIYDPNDPSAVEPMEGIVRLEGDTLTMCLGTPGDRPNRFDEGGFPVFIFKRKAQP